MIKSIAKKVALASVAVVVTSPAFADIDVTAATTAISTDGTAAVTAIGTALIGLAGVAVVFKWVKAAVFG